MSSAWPATNRPANALIAVLPLPNRSHATPVRVAQSFQFGTLLISLTVTAWVKLLAGFVCAGIIALNQSHRAPRLMVNRCSFHWSCPYTPPSRLITCLFNDGPFDTDTRYGLLFSVNRIAMSLL